MSVYGELREAGVDLIAEFGRTVTLRKVAPGTYSAATDSMTGGSVTDIPVKAVFTLYREQQIDGEIIERGDLKVLVANTKPEKDDRLIDGVDVYTVINVDTIAPGDTAILYRAQVRK